MSAKAKTILIISGTLVIGIGIGALGIGSLRQTRQQRFEMMPPAQRFIGAMERIIQPSEGQREAISRTLAKHSEQLEAIHERHQDEIFAVYDSLRNDFASLLTDEQRRRLEENLVRGVDRRLEMRVAGLAEELELDDHQVEKIREVMSQRGERPPFGGRGFQGDPRELRRGMRHQFEKMSEEIEAVLTPEQREKYRELMMARRRSFGSPFRGPRHDRPPK